MRTSGVKSLAEWETLPIQDKDFWIGYELYRQNAAREWWTKFTKMKGKDGKPQSWFAPEVVFAMIELARIGY